MAAGGTVAAKFPPPACGGQSLGTACACNIGTTSKTELFIEEENLVNVQCPALAMIND